MTTKEYQKAKEIISKFPNGEALYKNSALFGRTIQTLVRGVSEYEMIEQLIRITEDTQKAHEHYMVGDTRPIHFPLTPNKE